MRLPILKFIFGHIYVIDFKILQCYIVVLIYAVWI